MDRSQAKLAARFHGLLFVVGLATFVVHELAHWITGVALGYDMVATLNSVWSTETVAPSDQLLVTASGPLLTILQGVIGYRLVANRGSRFGFALLYMAFFMRLVAAGISTFNPNDEARLSLELGLGTWTLPLLVVGFLLALTVVASRRLELGFRDLLFCFVTASLAVSTIVGADMLIWDKS
ncbi:MAG: hypothetical protein AAF604_05520 [Acidobacteriota bacterium]